jgi:hypothetical protein
MNILSALLLQSALLGGPNPTDELPKFSEVELDARQGGHQAEAYPWIGLEAMAVWTSFDSGLHIENRWGWGADGKITLDFGRKVNLAIHFGCLGWNTHTNPSEGIPETLVQVRQYRVGIAAEIPLRFLEFRVGANFGGYRFRRQGDDDTAGFFELQGGIGARPTEFVWIGINAMQTFTVTSFNHSGDHSYINYSIGPAVEVRF